jgi:hypothetical protein
MKTKNIVLIGVLICVVAGVGYGISKYSNESNPKCESECYENGQRTDVPLTAAVKCEEFTRTADGSWYAKSVSLNYGQHRKKQINLSGSRITKDAQPELFAALNAKCGAGR